MNAGIMLLIMLVFVAVFGGMGYMVYVQLKKTDPTKVDSSVLSDITTAQEFLPFEDIKHGVIDLGGHNYRAIIECSSTNYNLKTDQEKELIELSFQRFVNSLTFPVAFFIQTKVLDNTKMIESMKVDMDNAIEKYPQMTDYAKNYFKEMSELSNHIGNNKQKKKYIIIPYNEANNLDNFSDKEKYNYSVKEIQSRGLMLIDLLQSIGVKATLLDTKGLSEVIYSTYHKENYLNFESIANGEYLTMMVDSEVNREEVLTDDARIDWILYEAQMRIKNELISKDLPVFIKSDYEGAITSLDSIRKDLGAYFKEDNSFNLNKEEN